MDILELSIPSHFTFSIFHTQSGNDHEMNLISLKGGPFAGTQQIGESLRPNLCPLRNEIFPPSMMGTRKIKIPCQITHGLPPFRRRAAPAPAQTPRLARRQQRAASPRPGPPTAAGLPDPDDSSE